MKKINADRAWIISDTHFGVRNSSEDWITIQNDYFFKWFIPLVRKNYKSGDVLLHLGDVFDSRQSINLKVLNLSIKVFEELSKIFKDGIYIICGNHDNFSKSNNDISSLVSLKWIPNINIFNEPESLLAGDKSMFLMPWRKDHDSEREVLAGAKEHDYMFCHSDIKGLMFNKFVRIDDGLSYDDLNKFGKVYSGHIHYAQKFGKITMAGSPYQITRSDTDNIKEIILLDIKTGNEEHFKNEFSPKFIRITFNQVLNSTTSELNLIFNNNFIDILVDPDIAVKAPLGMLTDYIVSPLKITFTPTTKPDEAVIDEGFHNLDGKNLSILDLTKMYLDNCNFEENKKSKIYNAIDKLFRKISTQQDKGDKDYEDKKD